MINLRSNKTVRVAQADWDDWRWQQRHSITDLQELQRRLTMPVATVAEIEKVNTRYPFSVSPYYLSLARQPSLTDPILRQCLPAAGELQSFPGESADPFAELKKSPVPGLIRRYRDRALLTTNGLCPVLCRHCFRKRGWKYHLTDAAHPANLERIITYLNKTPEIREVLVSGGEPLMLEDEILARLLSRLRRVPSIEVIRIATRLPATLPQRITPELVRMIATYGPIWIVAHFNHPLELTDAGIQACNQIVEAGIPMVSQTVLLQSVNDNEAVLRQLFTRLLSMRIKPYYLFHCDPATGTMHFRVTPERGRKLIRKLRATTSGLAIPTYAADRLDAPSKIPLG